MTDRDSDTKPADKAAPKERRKQAEEILSEHLTRHPAKDTDLNALCAEHPKFTDELRSLFRQLEAEGSFRTLTTAAAGSPLPQQIGPYRILEKIGEGGMGAVYVAEQREPVRRRVALKVIGARFSGATRTNDASASAPAGPNLLPPAASR